MADEITTDLATVVGLMERVQSRVDAKFRYSSVALEAFSNEPINDASTGQVPSFPAPSAVSATADGNLMSATAVTIGQKTLTLAAYAAEAYVTRLSMGGGKGVPEWVLDVLANNVIAGVDKMAFAQLHDFTNDITSVNTYAEWCTSVAAVQEYGYNGPLRCIMSFTQHNTIAADAAGKFVPRLNDEFASRGYWGNANGVDIWLCQNTLLSSSAGGIWVHPYGVSIGFRQFANGAIIEVRQAEYDTINDRIGVAAYAAATEVSVTGGATIAV